MCIRDRVFTSTNTNKKKYFAALLNMPTSHEDTEKQLKKQLPDLIFFTQLHMHMMYMKQIQPIWH
eukprot:3896302-Prorocentrum_lima.AAC.1